MNVTIAPFMTATGVDEHTNLIELAEMREVECGFLYSAGQAGRAKRYPTWDFILPAALSLPNACALHVCGRIAHQELMAEVLDVSPFARIQLNGRLTSPQLREACRQFPDKEIIAQYFGDNDEILAIDEPNLSILVDASGGNGILPLQWPKLDTELSVGFAGGLSPTNMFDQVLSIRKVARDGWWVDLESHLRVDEWFSLRKVQTALDEFEKAIDPQRG